MSLDVTTCASNRSVIQSCIVVRRFAVMAARYTRLIGHATHAIRALVVADRLTRTRIHSKRSRLPT